MGCDLGIGEEDLVECLAGLSMFEGYPGDARVRGPGKVLRSTDIGLDGVHDCFDKGLSDGVRGVGLVKTKKHQEPAFLRF